TSPCSASEADRCRAMTCRALNPVVIALGLWLALDPACQQDFVGSSHGAGSEPTIHPRDQTIFALSSGRPPSAISLVRVSGPQAGKIVTALAGKLPPPRMATRALLGDVGQRPIGDAGVLWFPGPASATGEDVAEFHVHGGRAVLAALFAALSAFEDVRPAEPGEFTRRAFEN